ncbi:hypothetical protein SAMN06297382_2815 [Amphiplicatus metriothermophilus]|uniref:Uncharacterized protein n=1 Tax=Amphiplicatus metriothermophilus TaxID=1519374 RepID=A0A239PZ69_9PROT|nr:hypothetical protein SAMN06297382_2815 [Amphiplicatus metriothermophilus]
MMETTVSARGGSHSMSYGPGECRPDAPGSEGEHKKPPLARKGRPARYSSAPKAIALTSSPARDPGSRGPGSRWAITATARSSAGLMKKLVS